VIDLRRSVILCAGAYAVGSIPFSNIAARVVSGVDLRRVGEGTVSGSGLFDVAGFRPLAAAAVAGHNWSPFLGGAGGRGISVGMGALAVRNWPGSIVLLAGPALGRIIDQAGLGGFVADVALVPILLRTRGWRGALAAVAVVVPMLAKRLTGNRAPHERSLAVYLHRLVLDSDPVSPSRQLQAVG
jgi:glycerol-3-phosphate acyltransferase PlsY